MFVSPYSLVGAHGIVNEWFSFKVFKDVVVFYTVMAAVVVFGSIAHFSPMLRKILLKRIPFARVPLEKQSKLQAYINHVLPRYISLGEIVIGATVGGLFVYWVWFWRWGYDRIENEAGEQQLSVMCCGAPQPPQTTQNPNDTFSTPYVDVYCPSPPSHPDLQIWARVVGHLSTFCIAFTMMPIQRHSIWESVLGTSYDRVVKYHRLMGLWAWCMVTLHMLLWWIKWGMEGTLGHNIFTINDLKITPTWV